MLSDNLIAAVCPDGILVVDPSGIVRDVNPAAEALLGWSRGEFVGHSIERMIPPELRERHRGLMRQFDSDEAVARRMASWSKLEALRRDGSLIPVCVWLASWAVNGTSNTMVFIRDQTEVAARESRVAEVSSQLSRTRHEARRAEERLAGAIAAMPDAFSVFDETDRLVMGNEAFFNLPQFEEIMSLGKSFEEIIREAAVRGVYDLQGADPESWVQDQLVLREKGLNGECVVALRNGRWLMRRERRTPQGEIVGVRFDITAMKLREEALRQAREEAEAANRAKTEFIANASHELRTPINSVIGFNQLMLDSGLNAGQQEFATIIKASSEHLLHLVDNILEMAKVVGNCIELSEEPFRLASLLRETLTSLTPLADAKGIGLEARIEIADEIAVKGDPGKVRQILLNILGNAVKFTSKGAVTLTACQAPGGGYLIEVHDTGPGIPPDKHEAIFERFERVRNGGTPQQGTGLGLAITRSLVMLMNGEIAVRSEPGRGSTFSVRLPLRRAAAVTRPGDVAGEQRPGPRFEDPDGLYDILVAEDHPFNQVLIRNVLNKAGCELTMVENGRDLLDRLDTADFDLVILDNQMPIMSGVDAAKAIRSRRDWKMRIPIIALTADVMTDAEQTYGQIGVDAFITKPIDVAQVIETVRRLAKDGRALRTEACL